MAEPLLLTIDAGNTRTKWGIFDAAGELKAYGVCANAELGVAEMPIAWRACERAVISNVAGNQVTQALAKWLQPLNIASRQIASTESACGVSNRYENPQQLGSDRWAALIAAWHHYHAPCVVVNAGTALTVDALAADAENGRGIFLGGLILPGLNLMQGSLLQGTADLATRLENEDQFTLQDFPVNTHQAIHSGILSAMMGAIASMYAKLQHAGYSPWCVLTGGDAALLADGLLASGALQNDRVVIADNLTLQGLLLIEREFA